MKRKGLKKLLAVVVSVSMILGTGIVALADGEGDGDGNGNGGIPSETEECRHVEYGDAYYNHDNDGHWLERVCKNENCDSKQYSPDDSWNSPANGAGSFTAPSHTYNTNGICICGYECPHNWDKTTGTCTDCKMTHSHNWSNGKCSVCEYTCAHSSWNSETGKCSVCGRPCAHTWDSATGKCSKCGYECPHNCDWQISEDMDKCKCYNCGLEKYHTGGIATCREEAKCEICNHKYGQKDNGTHVYTEEWEANGAEGHKKVPTCDHVDAVVIRESHTFNTSTHKCTECGYECTHPYNPDDCSICGYKKPVAPAPIETKEEAKEETKKETKEEIKKDDTVTVTASVVVTHASVTPTTLSLTPSIENALVKASSNDTPVFIDMTKASVIPEAIVEKIFETNASVNLTLSKDTVLGISNSTLNGTVAAPIVVKTAEPKEIGSLLETTVNIPKDKKVIVMSPVKGATTSNTAVIYQNYGKEMAGKVVNFYVADQTGKFWLYTSAVVYPNGYAAFTVPVVGFVGYVQ